MSIIQRIKNKPPAPLILLTFHTEVDRIDRTSRGTYLVEKAIKPNPLNLSVNTVMGSIEKII
jgi:hypothetical protein